MSAASDDVYNAGIDDDDVTCTMLIHIRVQQRNGRKMLTTIQGLAARISARKVLGAMRRKFCCNGTVICDEKLGDVIQLQGDHRAAVRQFLVDEDLVASVNIRMHGG